jgi:hypothetical protein
MVAAADELAIEWAWSEMGSRDFLHTNAKTPLCEYFVVTGAVCRLSTNFEPILEAAHESFFPVEFSRRHSDFQLRFWVDATARATPPWPKPFFRGLDHLIFGGFESENSILVDRYKRRVIGRFSPAMGADRAYWKRVVFSNLLTALSGSIGVTELHCGCAVRGSSGLLLSGCSGSGKSTLALALARAGFVFLSDDRTWVSYRDGRLQAWGLPTLLKLRPDAVALFPELRDLKPSVLQDGRTALQVDVGSQLGLPRALRCEPHWLVFLERHESPTSTLTRMPAEEAAARLSQDLLPEAPSAAEKQWETIQRLVDRGCWLLRFGGTPQEASELLTHLVESGFEREPKQVAIATAGTQWEATPEDPFRLQTPTPHSADLKVMGRTVRLETNSPMVLTETKRLLQCYAGSGNGAGRCSDSVSAETPAFRWKIVTESLPIMNPPWPRMSAFSDHGIRYTSIGQRNFVAVDLDQREAVGFLAAGLAADEPGFCSLFLDPLFCMTAAGLGLTAVFSSCVGLEGRGLLVFGPPGSGKTTSSYVAREMGIGFYADQATFLELEGDTLRVWAGFLPAAFRPEALQFLPQLRHATRPISYLDSTFLELNMAASRSDWPVSLAPVGCVFLDRDAARPARLVPLDRTDLSRRLKGTLLFKEDPRFSVQRRAVLSALERLPSSLIAYGDDPAEAAPFFQGLLTSNGLQRTGQQTEPAGSRCPGGFVKTYRSNGGA